MLEGGGGQQGYHFKEHWEVLFQKMTCDLISGDKKGAGNPNLWAEALGQGDYEHRTSEAQAHGPEP